MRRITQIITALALPIPVLVAAEVLLQWHGWTFWATYFDPLAGPALSLTLAVLAASWWAVAAWSRRWPARLGYGLLALVASLVLLSGPLYQVSAPIVQASEAARALPARLASLDAAIEARRAELDKYLTITASGRYGWHGRIDDARTALAELEARRVALVESAPESVSWQRQAAAGLQAVALVLLQIGAASMAALAGSRLRKVHEMAAPAEFQSEIPAPEIGEPAETQISALVEIQPEIPTAEIERPAETQISAPTEIPAPEIRRPAGAVFRADDLTVRRLQREARRQIEAARSSAKRWCEDHGVSPRDLSLLLNHDRLVRDGKQTISGPKLQALGIVLMGSAALNAAGGES